MMENKELNLVEILKDCPKETKLYTPLFGEVLLLCVDLNDKTYPIYVKSKIGRTERFTKDGVYNINYRNVKCLLFPSKENRDWSTFKAPKPKFDPKTLQPFDKVLVRNANDRKWLAVLFSHTNAEGKVEAMGCAWRQVIPYNEETKHLVGTTEEPQEHYKYWEE